MPIPKDEPAVSMRVWSLILVLLVAHVRAEMGGPCEHLPGKCMASAEECASTNGYMVAGLCPKDGAGVRCCVSRTELHACEGEEGVCMPTRLETGAPNKGCAAQGGEFVSRKCPHDPGFIKCCKGVSAKKNLDSSLKKENPVITPTTDAEKEDASDNQGAPADADETKPDTAADADDTKPQKPETTSEPQASPEAEAAPTTPTDTSAAESTPAQNDTPAATGHACTGAEGVCLDVASSTQQCEAEGGKFVSGKCPHDGAGIKCCVKSAPVEEVPPTTGQEEAAAPTTGHACTGAEGVCLDVATSAQKCEAEGGKFISGKCPQDGAGIKCCTKSIVEEVQDVLQPRPPLDTAVDHGQIVARYKGKYLKFMKGKVVPGDKTLQTIDMQDLIKAYPFGTAEEVKKKMGGAANAAWIENTCALRMSDMLAKAGLAVFNKLYMPSPPELQNAKAQTVSVRDGTRRLFRVRVLTEAMAYLLGPPTFTHKKKPLQDGHEAWKAFQGKYGIIQFDINFADATGHFDLWSGDQVPIVDSDEDIAALWDDDLYKYGSMVENHHQSENLRYFSMASKINIWEVPCKNPGECFLAPNNSPPESE